MPESEEYRLEPEEETSARRPATPTGNTNVQPIVIQPKSRWFARLLFVTGWLFGCVCLLVALYAWGGRSEYYDTTGDVTEEFHSGNAYAADTIAIIHVTGVILDGEGYVKSQMDRIRENDNIKAVVLRVDSPGGTVSGSHYIYDHLKQLCEERKLKLVVSMGSMAASGGYYVAMAVGDEQDAIFAEQTTTTGSIGVIVPHYDLTGLMDEHGVKDDSIVSGENKQLLSMTRKINDEQRAILQAYVDESFEEFKSVVKYGRPHFAKNPEELDNLATGEIFTGKQALKHKLVDKIGYLDDAIKRAAELAGLKKDQYAVIQYSRIPSLTDVFGFAQANSPDNKLKTMFELSTPRAYYLHTSLPPLPVMP